MDLLFIFLLIVIFIVIIHIIIGKYDPFYRKFIFNRNNSLIIGSSRALQGIVSEEINSSKLKKKYTLPIYNYAFTLVDASFGEIYNKSIKNKIRNVKVDKKGLFIIVVDPWSLSSIKNDPDNEYEFRERGNLIDRMKHVNLTPNYEYLIRSVSKKWLKNLLKNVKEHKLNLHLDGWLEVSLSMDAFSVEKRKKKKMDDYLSSMVDKVAYSKKREKSLISLIEFLNKNGDIFLVRVPIGNEIYKIEESCFPEFDKQMLHLCKELGAAYICSQTKCNQITTTDGVHMFKDDARVFTRELSELIFSWKN